MNEYVLIHGSWHGAWCWDRLARRLRSSGRQTQALTLLGLGERAEELQPYVDLRVHAEDLQRQLARRRQGCNAVLVAHSYAGMVVAWIASQLPAYGFCRVVLLDAFLPLPGQSAFDIAPDLLERLMNSRVVGQD